MEESSLVRKHLRSRRGCFTCRAKKVKCDEQRYTCSRCKRLRLECVWTARPRPSRPSVSQKELLPKASAITSSATPDPEYSTHVLGPDGNTDLDVDVLALAGIETSLDETANALSATMTVPVPNPWESQSLNDMSSLEIILDPSFQVSSQEYRAVNHFQVEFSLSRTSKKPPWSTHSLMLRMALGAPTVMHLIIASSLTDLAFRTNDVNLCNLCRRHYQTGARMLLLDVSSRDQNHSQVLTCFFLLYVCMSFREDTAEAVSRLSSMTLNHIKAFSLLEQSSEPAIEIPMPRDERTYIARLIVWLVYEDSAALFATGRGGELARYARRHAASMDAIYEQSSAVFGSCWGAYYPDSEAVDDVENSTVLRFLFDTMCLFQDINQVQEDRSGATAIELRLDALEEKSQPLFRLSTVKDSYHSRLLTNVDWAIALFYSLRLYLYRSLDEVTISSKVFHAMTSILLIVQRRLSAGRDDMFRNFHMPLFMAGIETNDPIHREWVASKLNMPRYKRSIREVLQFQHDCGIRADWSTVQEILRGEHYAPFATSLSKNSNNQYPTESVSTTGSLPQLGWGGLPE